MNKLAILVLSTSMVAAAQTHAQSSVTVFGVLDAAVRKGTGSIGDRTSLGSGGIAGSRIGFRGVEDLGGGLKASFWLEAQIDVSTGVGTATNTNNQASGAASGTAAVQFNRQSTVSLSGRWGELRLGRDYTPQFKNVNGMDPFQTNGVGSSNVLLYSQAGLVSARASNSIGYFLPSDLPVYGQAMVYAGENVRNGAVTQNDGQGWAVRVGRRAGAYNVSAAVAKTTYAAGDITTINLGGSYVFGALTLMGTYQQDDVSSAPGKGRGYLLGSTYKVGSGLVRAAYSTYKRALPGDPRSSKLAIGYVHNLSARTALYGTVAHVKNKGSANLALADAVTAAGRGSSGIEFGMRHNF